MTHNHSSMCTHVKVIVAWMTYFVIYHSSCYNQDTTHWLDTYSDVDVAIKVIHILKKNYQVEHCQEIPAGRIWYDDFSVQ